MAFNIAPHLTFGDLSRQEGQQNLQNLAALQEMQVRQESLADLMRKRQQEQSLQEAFAQAVKQSTGQPDMAAMKPIAQNLSQLTKFGPPTEQASQTIGDLYTQAENLPKTGLNIGMLTSKLMENPLTFSKGLELQQATAKEEKPYVVGRSLMSSRGDVLGVDPVYQQEQKANREAKMAEVKLRLGEQGLARQERNALQRERLDLTRDQLQQKGVKISRLDEVSINKSLENATNVNEASGILDQAEKLYSKYATGRYEPAFGVAARYGFGDKNRAADYETALQIQNDLGSLKLQRFGGSDTEKELQVAISTSPSPDKLPETNMAIIQNQKRAIDIIQAEPDFKTQWIEKNGSLSKTDPQTGQTYGQAWRKYQKENFVPVEVPTGKGIKTAQPAQPSQPNQVILPNGTVKTFPSPAAAQAFKKAAGL